MYLYVKVPGEILDMEYLDEYEAPSGFPFKDFQQNKQDLNVSR